jgi:hypothetical protein
MESIEGDLLRAVVSPERLQPYYAACEEDSRAAVRLYA